MTPHPLAYRMAMLADVSGKTVLDPTAGEGRLLLYAEELGAAKLFGFEIDETLARFAGVAHADFLDVPEGGPVADVLLINPSFTRQGPDTARILKKAIAHHWSRNGKAAVILPGGPTGDRLITPYLGLVIHEETLDPTAFVAEGTSVRTKLYVLEEPFSSQTRK